MGSSTQSPGWEEIQETRIQGPALLPHSVPLPKLPNLSMSWFLHL